MVMCNFEKAAHNKKKTLSTVLVRYYFNDLSVLFQNFQVYQQLAITYFPLTLQFSNMKNHRENFKTSICALSQLIETLNSK